MKIVARSILAALAVPLALLVSITVRVPLAYGQAAYVRWDLIELIGPAPGTIEAGGLASALANDNSAITLSGAGTFVAPAGGGGTSSAVTGGGNWETFDASGGSTGGGTYRVTGLVRWEEAAGTLAGTGGTDTIGSLTDTHAGLAVLRIEYSDGEPGVLVVSCRLPGAPASIFEGMTASKGFVDYWNRVAPVGFDGNRTLFHILR